MSLIDRRLGVAYEADELGLVCAPAGVSLAGAPLLEKTVRGLVPRPFDEISKLATAAYADYAELGVHLVTYKILMKILLSEWSRRHVCR